MLVASRGCDGSLVQRVGDFDDAKDGTHLLNRSIFSPLKLVLPFCRQRPYPVLVSLSRKSNPGGCSRLAHLIGWCGGKAETQAVPSCRPCPLWHVGRARSVENEGHKPFHVVIGDSLVGRLPLRLRPFPPDTC